MAIFGILAVFVLCGIAVTSKRHQDQKVEAIKERVDKAIEERDRIDAKAAAKPLPIWLDEASKTEAPEVWREAGKEPFEVGSVRIEVTHATRTYTSVENRFGQYKQYLDHVDFHIFLEITNKSDAKLLDYAGYCGMFHPALFDNLGNTYRQVSVPKDARLQDSRVVFPSKEVNWVTAGFRIHPERSITDVLIFEEPVQKIEWLKLELPGKAFGESGPARFLIPRAFIYRGEKQ